MEINVTKQRVATNEIIFEQSVEQAVDTDFMLPDYCADIVRVLKCRMCPRILSKSVSGDSLIVDGVAAITLIYCDDNKKICSFEQEVPFQKNISLKAEGEDCNVTVTACTDYLNCRPITPRKVDVHGVVALKVSVSGCRKTDIITDIDAKCMHLKRGFCPATNPISTTEKIVVIEEELELALGKGNILSILRNDVSAVIDECKLIGSKAVIKGDLVINALYCTTEGNAEVYENKIPFNQIMDVVTEGEDCKCSAKIDVMSSILKPRTNISGECKSFSFETKLCIKTIVSCDNDLPLIYDAFNTEKPITFDKKMVAFKKLESTHSERFLCKKMLEFSENSFGSVIDMWCEEKINGVKIKDGVLVSFGTVLICILLRDAEGEPQYYERAVDFEYKHNIEADMQGLSAEVTAKTASKAYTIAGDSKLEARIELLIVVEYYRQRKEDVITEVAVLEDGEIPTKKAPIVVYFADKGEEIWEIAKRYNSAPEDICSLNKLEGEKIENPCTVIIP